MELHQLECFVLVLEEGGFKRATAALKVTQPALSYQIKQLEEELGVQLFHRRPGGVMPTEAGRILLQHAHHLIKAVHKAHQAVRELSDGITGEIRIGTINSVGTYFLPQILWDICAKHPSVRPQLVYRSSNELLDVLLANKLDVALLADPSPDQRLRFETLFEEPLSLVFSRSHPFFGRDRIKPAELVGERFIALSPQTPTGALVRSYLEGFGVNVDLVLSTDSVDTVKRMVEAGLGSAVLPDMVTNEDIAPEGQTGEIGRSALDPPLTRRVTVVTWRDGHPSRAADAFIDEVRRTARKWRASHS